jgi:hypothetical protein
MSHTYNALANIKNINSKIHYHEYLGHSDEPKHENLGDGMSRGLDTDLIRNSYYQKLKIRRTARRLRYVSHS